MALEVKMPNLSQTTDEVQLIKWVVEEGDEIKKGDVLCEVQTDKVNMEVESFAEGNVLKLIGEPGEQIKAGSVIAVIGKAGEELEKTLEQTVKDDQKKDSKGSDKEIERNQVSKKSVQKVKATRLVQKLADRKNVDLGKITGTGPRGIITKKDLEDFILRADQKPVEDGDYYSLSSNQQAVSANLAKSKGSIPHYYLKAEVLADPLLKNRNTGTGGKKMSMYSYFVYYSAKALEAFPRLNGYFKDNKIYKNPHINIGFAVNSGDELYVPVVRDANKKNISKIDEEVKWLAAKAQNKKLQPEDISEGTFTITNLGIYPIDEFYGVINYPQAVLLAIGQVKKELKIASDNSMSIKSIVNITASFDHRIANGAQAASFLEKIKELLEEV